MDADEITFSALFERHRRELQTHCYRMELFGAFGLPMSFPPSRGFNQDERNAKEVR